MVNVNETTPKLTRPEQTTLKCHQTAIKMSTNVHSNNVLNHIVKWALYGLAPTSSNGLFMVHKLEICEKHLHYLI
jgi:hypothetical protein